MSIVEENKNYMKNGIDFIYLQTTGYKEIWDESSHNFKRYNGIEIWVENSHNFKKGQTLYLDLCMFRDNHTYVKGDILRVYKHKIVMTKVYIDE